MNYILFSFLSSILFVIYESLYKFTDVVKLPVNYYICIWYLFAGFFAFIYLITNKVYQYKFKTNHLLIIAIISIITLVGNFFYFNACKIVDNPGLSRATYSAFLILILTTTSYIFFNKKINLYEFLGIIFILFGICLILVK